MSSYYAECGCFKVQVLEPPVSSSVPMLEGMIHQVEEHSGSLAQEATSAAVRVQSVERVVYHVAAAAKMSSSEDTFDFIRGAIDPRKQDLELADDAENATFGHDAEKNGEVQSGFEDEGYGDDGKADATTQVGLKDLPEKRRAVPGPSASNAPAHDPASRLPLYVPPSSVPAPSSAPVGLGIYYSPPTVTTLKAPTQNYAPHSNVYPGWSATNPILLSPSPPSPSCSCPGCNVTDSIIPSPTSPVAESYPGQFFLSQDANGQVFMAPITGESNAPIVNIPRQGRPVRMKGSYVARVPQQNYLIENGVRTTQSQSTPSESTGRYPAWSAPVVGKGKKRAYSEISDGYHSW